MSMDALQSDVLIVGAGLSGLTAAYTILKNAMGINERLGDGAHHSKEYTQDSDVDKTSTESTAGDGISQKIPTITILEARNRHGGRVYSDSEMGYDYGGAWIWPGATPHVESLIAEFKDLEVFPHVEQTMDGSRMKNGMQSLTDCLLQSISKVNGVKVVYEYAVSEFEVIPPTENDTKEEGVYSVRVSAPDQPTYRARTVIMAVPPRLASEVSYTPELSPEHIAAMRKTNTWMANTGKVLMSYDTPWWMMSGLSDTFRIPRGPIMQFFDHSDKHFSTPVLGGFITPHAPENDAQLKDAVTAQLAQIFGEKHAHPAVFSIKRWYTDPYTVHKLDLSGSGGHPRANRILKQSEIGGALVFAGAESALGNTGLLDGAVEAGKRAALEVVQFLEENEHVATATHSEL